MDCPQSCLEYSRVYYYSHICTREKLIGLTHILRQERHPIYSHHGNVSPLPLELIHCQSKHPNNTPVWPAHSPTHSLTSNLTLEVWKMTMCFTVPCFYFENLWSIPTMLKRHWEENCDTWTTELLRAALLLNTSAAPADDQQDVSQLVGWAHVDCLPF